MPPALTLPALRSRVSELPPLLLVVRPPPQTSDRKLRSATVFCRLEEALAPVADAKEPHSMLTTSEAMQLLGVSRSALMSAIKLGSIPAVKVGTRIWRIPREAIDRMLTGKPAVPAEVSK
jgi:excisionase family DNA binding protein